MPRISSSPLMAGSPVRLSGLRSRAEFNGTAFGTAQQGGVDVGNSGFIWDYHGTMGVLLIKIYIYIYIVYIYIYMYVCIHLSLYTYICVCIYIIFFNGLL